MLKTNKTPNMKNKASPIKKTEQKEYYPVSLQQEGVYLQAMLDTDNTVWNTSHSWRYAGRFDLDAFKNAVHDLTRRHASLRTNFVLQKEEILQTVHDTVSLSSVYTFEDLSTLPDEEKETRAARIEKEAAKRPYDPASDPLIRFTVIRLAPCDHVIVIGKHHIISDAASRQILWRELVAFYNSRVTGEPYEPAPLEIHYHDYAVWEREFVNSPRYLEEKKYWLRQLDGPLPLLNLPTDFPRGEDRRAGTIIRREMLDNVLTARLRSFGLRNRMTFSTAFLSAFYIVLNRYCGQNDIVIGGLYRGRNRDKNLSKIIGLFANRIAMRLNLDDPGNSPVKELLSRVDKKIVGAYKNQDFLFEDLIRAIHPRRTESHAPVFQAVFNMVKVPAAGLDFHGQERREWHEFEPDTNITSQYDLSLYIRDDLKTLTVKILYSKNLFRAETIERMLAGYITVLSEIVTHPEKELSGLEIVTAEEKQRLLYDFNDTAADYPREKTIHQLFEEQAERTPGAIAIHMTHGTHTTHTTYNELNRRAGQIAVLLWDKGVRPGDIVGIMLERSVEMILGIYGILKAGAAYLPIDPGYPEERINYILRDSNAGVLLTNRELSRGISAANHVISLGATHPALRPPLKGGDLPGESAGNGFALERRTASPAYVIYTSGSTGKPKGVMVEHTSAVNILWALQEKYPFLETDTYLLKTSYVFDVSVAELFGWFLGGGRLAVLEKGAEKDPLKIYETIKTYRVTHINFVPSMFNVFVELFTPEHQGNLSTLKYIFLAGEALLPELVERFARLDTGIPLENIYGPTEGTIYAANYSLRRWSTGGPVPIGSPMPNVTLIISDKDGNLQPVGVPGELLISGTGLARGYLNNPELTAEKFFYKSHRTCILYRTGDLARWLPDGNIEFLGRIDHQVKIRGFRVELGEIETVLNKHTGVNNSVVMAVENEAGDKSLCAYLVPSDKENLSKTELRDYLSVKLPGYMVPTYFLTLEKMPSLPGGKVDRNALPKPGVDETIRPETAYEAPKNEMQEKMVLVWQDVLGLKTVGIDDHFIAVGGDSIKAIQVISRLRGYGYKLDISAIFKHFTIDAVSPYVETIDADIDQDPVTGDTALIPIQQWFIEKNFNHAHHWNQSVFLYREGGFNADTIKKVLNRLVEHHDLLRAVLSPRGRAMNIKAVDESTFDFTIFDLTMDHHPGNRIPEEVEKLQRRFDLYNGPLIIVCLFRTGDGGHLFIAAHHLVIDGVSWRVLLEDIATGYKQAEHGREITFPPKTHSYKKWSETLKKHSRSGTLLREYDYWKPICSEKTTILQEKKGIEKGKEKGKLADYYRCRIELDKEQSRLLLNETNRAYNTGINDILLSGLSRAIRECFDLKKIVIHLEGHGRETIGEGIDVSRTVGWFTSLFPVLLEVREEESPGKHICRTKDSLRKIPNRGIGYGILRFLAELPEDQREALLVDPEICFNYLGRFDEDLSRNDFRRSPYSTGDSKSPQSEQVYKLNITGKVLNSKLTFTISGDTLTFQIKKIETFARCFKDNLEEIVRHCTAVKEPVYTPSDFNAPLLDFDELQRIHDRFDLKNIDNIYHLSPMQEGMLFHHLYDQGNRAYVVQLNYLLEGDIDADLFEKSCRQLVKRHDVFRTAFVYDEIKKPVQVILKDREIEFVYHDLIQPSNDNSDREDHIDRIATSDHEKGFDLLNGALIRFTLIKIHGFNYWLLVTYHHIIMDGWSTNLWLKDFLTLYQQEVPKRGTGPREEEYPYYPYSNYLQWLEDRDLTSAFNYWRSYLAAFDRVTHVRPYTPATGAEYLKREHTLDVPRETYERLSQLARKFGVTLNNVLQGVWGVVLHCCTGSGDVLFGNVISGRNVQLEGIERITGLFINTIPMRIKIEETPQKTFTRMLEQIRDGLMESQEYGYLQLAEVQGCSSVEGPLFDHIYIYENYPVNREISSPRQAEKTGFTLTRKYSIEHTNFDLNVVILPRRDLLVRFVYNENVYDNTFIAQLAGFVQQVIAEVLQQPDRLISDIGIISEEEKQQLLNEFNDTAADYPKEKTIHQLFEEQVARTPDAVALNMSDTTYTTHMTYNELNRKADQLFYMLREKGVQSETIVGIMMERSIEMIIGILGILKAGGAYMPIEPDYPEMRINYMMKDSAATVLLTQKDAEDMLACSRVPDPVTGIRPRAASLCYIIYTSGSTGLPKGVMIRHYSVVNLAYSQKKTFNIGEKDRILQFSSICFDASVEQIFISLFSGSCLVLIDKRDILDMEKFGQFLDRQSLTHIHSVPTFIKNIPVKKYPGLKRMVSGGDECPLSLARQWNKYHDFCNEYGPTETTVTSIELLVKKGGDKREFSIGKPINNTVIHILDRHMRPVPVGVPGELCIAGHGLARGYLNKPGLTAERFNNTLYRTGDLARRLPDRNIEYLGRIDHQVKIRGNRIELGEIETVLNKNTAVKESVAAVIDDNSGKPGEKSLCAYIVPDGNQNITVEQLREYLATALPDYMIPSYFVQIEKIPLTFSGKADRKSLPAPDQNIRTGTQYEAPADETENALVSIWRDILKIKQIGTHDSFFSLGGHSLRIMNLAAQIRKTFHVELSLRQLFDNPTIKQIAEIIRTKKEKQAKFEQILQEIEGLSAQQVRALLG